MYIPSSSSSGTCGTCVVVCRVNPLIDDVVAFCYPKTKVHFLDSSFRDGRRKTEDDDDDEVCVWSTRDVVVSRCLPSTGIDDDDEQRDDDDVESTIGL